MKKLMSNYQYKCTSCGTIYEPEKIEQNRIYLCGECGLSEKNRPLRGVLNIEYDYDSIKNNIIREDFLKLPVGKFWLYPFLWPLDKGFLDKFLVSDTARFALTNEPVNEFRYGEGRISIFDDTRNPTFSYKDRATSLVVLKALEMGITEIAAASTGNAGSSLAGMCARMGLKAHIFVPKNIPSAKRIQIQAYGANLYLVDGDYDAAFDLSLEISDQMGWYNRNTAYNPLTIEGKKSAAFDIFIATQGNIPDIIFVPVGDGVILSGIFKGFQELKQLGWIENLPHLIGVQAEGSDALVRYMKTGKFEYRPAKTIADSIHAGAPRNLYMAANAIDRSKGCAITVSDDEIIDAQKLIAKEFGILTEPAAAAGFAGFRSLRGDCRVPETGRVMIMLTGNGLKDLQSLEQWNPSPEIRSVNNWKEFFKSG
ncbi:MAG: threonine synthase [Calditrichaceae bacterium]